MTTAKYKVKQTRQMTVAEYLERERAAFERSEYIDGEIYHMAGESDAHGDISVNLVASLRTQLKETEWREILPN